MPRSIKINYFFNLINSITQILFPLLTFPYASRIMLADGIGQVQFYNAIISYISLFTCLGIPLYAVREIAKIKTDTYKMSITTIEIIILHAILSIIGYIAVGIICISVPEVQENTILFIILSLSIFFTAIGCEWFYKGIEDFKYVAIRGLIIKIISVVLLFVLVKSKEDILWYGLYNVIGVLGGNLFNFFRLRKYITPQNIQFKNIHPFRHLRSTLKIFIFNLTISLYLQLNTLLLGFIGSNASVGYFTAATKLISMIMLIPSSLSSVVLARSSQLVASGCKTEFNRITQKSYDFIISISLPLCTGLLFCSKSAILLLSGSDFSPSIIDTQILAINIFSVGISGVLGMQILYPLGKMKIVLLSTIIGAFINIISNIILIKILDHTGTAIAYMLAELTVTLSMIYFGKKYFKLIFIKKEYMNYLLGSLIMGSILYIISLFELNNILTLLLMVFWGGSSYLVFLIISKDQFIVDLKQLIISSIKK